jgi:hypothetical protein
MQPPAPPPMAAPPAAVPRPNRVVGPSVGAPQRRQQVTPEMVRMAGF